MVRVLRLRRRRSCGTLKRRSEAVPRFATPRNPQRETLGPKVAKILKWSDPEIGQSGQVMPWQADTLDVACEIDPATGLFWYRNVVLIVPRQSGKTSLSRAKVTHRCLTTPRRSVLYTAQDRGKSLRRLQKNFYDPLSESPLAHYLGRPRWTNGSEAVRFVNKAEIIIDAPTKKQSGHGETLPEAHIDEAFAHVDGRIEQAVSPAQITVEGAQKWITSAAGNTDSVFLWNKVQAGRSRIEAFAHDPAELWKSRTCYIEYSAPEDADRADPDWWYRVLPALGWTISEEALAADQETMDTEGPDEWNRAYFGWWPTAERHDVVIPYESWTECVVDAGEDPWRGVPVWSVDIAPDRSFSSIGLAAEATVGGRIFGEVVKRREGTLWVVDGLVKLRAMFDGNDVVIDGAGAASSLERDLLDEGFNVVRLATRQKVDACGGLFDAVLERGFSHLDDPVLNDAVASAAKRNMGSGEGGFYWVRGKSLQDITPLYAVTLAWFEMRRRISDEYDIDDSIG